jgi:hypothetical protein
VATRPINMLLSKKEKRFIEIVLDKSQTMRLNYNHMGNLQRNSNN